MTSPFKEQIREDVGTIFLNPFEFADIHVVNGTPMAILIDANEQIEREKRMSHHIDGVYQDGFLAYVSSYEYGPLPAQGSYIEIDDTKYRVEDAVEEDGVYSLTLAAIAPVTHPAGITQRGLPVAAPLSEVPP